jgi:RNA polymerase sigma-70 factor (ECF subfamily)
MMERMEQIADSSDTARLVQRAADGDQGAWDALMTPHRDRLRRMVSLRLDQRLQGRIDPSDVIQESALDAARRLTEYAKNPTMPFFLWLRYLTAQRLMEQHRRHLGAKARDARREISLYRGACPEATSATLAMHLLGKTSTPSQAAIRIEERIRLQQALDILEPIDREVLALRHFEQLSNAETAAVLGLEASATSKRYKRAVVHLRQTIHSLHGCDS